MADKLFKYGAVYSFGSPVALNGFRKLVSSVIIPFPVRTKQQPKNSINPCYDVQAILQAQTAMYTLEERMQAQFVKYSTHDWIERMHCHWINWKPCVSDISTDSALRLYTALATLHKEKRIAITRALCRFNWFDFEEWWSPETFAPVCYSLLPLFCSEYKSIWEPYYATWSMQYNTTQKDMDAWFDLDWCRAYWEL